MLLLGAFSIDAVVQDWIRLHQERSWKIFMRNVSRLGDWPAHLVVGLAAAAIAHFRKALSWRRVFVAMVIACALGGAVARLGKIATGRSRPSVQQEAGWNGPRFASKYHAFPSGHTAASTAFFVTLLLSHRRIGAALLVVPVLIGLSRMYVAAHYLSDVFGGAIVGCAAALVVWSFAFRRSADPIVPR